MNAFLLSLLLTPPASAASFEVQSDGDEILIREAAQQPPEPLAPLIDPVPEDYVVSTTISLAELARLHSASFQEKEKSAILAQIARTKPVTQEDLTWLLNIFTRDHADSRASAERSLALLDKSDRVMEPFFLRLINDDDRFLRMFGVLGAAEIQSEGALGPMRELASRKFSAPRPHIRMSPQEANDWNVQFQALRALAQAGDEKTFPLLEKRVKESPAVAALMASFYWKKTLPLLIRWIESSKPEDRERARIGFKAGAPIDDLRATLPELEKTMRSKSRKREARHQAALQLGFAADDAKIDALLADQAKESDPETKLMLTAALFASRSPKIVPLLTATAKESSSPSHRAGALYQLGEMIPKEEFRALLTWAAEHDPDMGNRETAKKRLAELQ